MAYSTINKSTSFFDTNLYNSTGSPITISGMDFQPSMVWSKMRTGNSSTSHAVVDQVRGGTNKVHPDLNNAETADASAVTAWTSDGYTFGTSGSFQNSSHPYVHWCWKGNGAGSSDSSGTAPTATVSANTTAGFSITKYTTGTVGAGITVPHGLGVAPTVILFKKLNAVGNMTMYHKDAGGYLYMINDAAVTTNSTWVTTTSSLVTLAETWELYNNASSTYVMYCFADISGYSKFGKYIGNGVNGEGTFIYLGFKPSYVLIKQINTTGNWALSDNKRKQNSGNTDNGKGNYVPHMLAVNSANEESGFGGGSSNKIDYLSNGFKMRDNGAYGNTSGGTYVYMAFGQPIISNSGVVATAR